MLSTEESVMAGEVAPEGGPAPDAVTNGEAAAQTASGEPAWEIYEAGRRAVAEGQFEEAVDIFSSVLESLYAEADGK